MANFTHGTNSVHAARQAPLWVRLWPLWIACFVVFAVFGKDFLDAARNLAAMRNR